MKQKFNPKRYQGKRRLYTPVPHSPRISRLWVWDDDAKTYRVPPQGKCYFAGLYEVARDGKRKRKYEFFASLEEARDWQNGVQKMPEPVADGPSVMEKARKAGPLFREVVEEWKRRRFPHIAPSTQVQYQKIIRLYFSELMELTIHEITPKRLDEWIDGLKNPLGRAMQRATRKSFEHELKLLSTILSYYQDYNDDAQYQFPIKERHREAVRLVRSRAAVPKDFPEEEFLQFRERIRAHRHGEILAALATVQYYQALRISEAAGLFWEDISLDRDNPVNSRIKIVRSICYLHRGGHSSFVQGRFKNADANSGIKEQPMFPQTYEALVGLYEKGRLGLIFQISGKHLEYRTIQSHYDRAFRQAGLPYRGTHVMRHGGCRRIYNENPDPAIAQQLLGNADLKTTLIYAKRHAQALTKVAQEHWQRTQAH